MIFLVVTEYLNKVKNTGWIEMEYIQFYTTTLDFLGFSLQWSTALETLTLERWPLKHGFKCDLFLYLLTCHS